MPTYFKQMNIRRLYRLSMVMVAVFGLGCAAPSMEEITYYNEQGGYIRQTSYGSFYTINRYTYDYYPFATNYFYHYGHYARHPSTYNNCLQANRLYWYCY